MTKNPSKLTGRELDILRLIVSDHIESEIESGGIGTATACAIRDKLDRIMVTDVRIKRLEWEYDKAQSIVGTYRVSPMPNGTWAVTTPEPLGSCCYTTHRSEVAAMEAGQKDFEERIRTTFE